MKLVGMLISLLIVSVLVIMVLRGLRLSGDDGAPQQPDGAPSAAFLGRCQETAPPQLPRPAEYCACLWRAGVTDLLQTMTSPRGRQATVACRAAQGR